jgi:hypothetical protein
MNLIARIFHRPITAAEMAKRSHAKRRSKVHAVAQQMRAEKGLAPSPYLQQCKERVG